MTSQNSQFDINHWIYRIIALIIDSIIIGIPAGIIYSFVIVPLLWPPVSIWYTTVNVAPWWSSLLLPLIIGIIQLFYFAILDSAWGATVGKRVLGLQVQTVSGGKVDFGKAFIRNITKIYGLLLLLDWVIGVATPGDKRQKYTDRMAGTTVVSIKQPFTAAPPPPPPPT